MDAGVDDGDRLRALLTEGSVAAAPRLLGARVTSRVDGVPVTVRLTEQGAALRADVAPIHDCIRELSGIRDDAHRESLIAELQDITARLRTIPSTSATPA